MWKNTQVALASKMVTQWTRMSLFSTAVKTCRNATYCSPTQWHSCCILVCLAMDVHACTFGVVRIHHTKTAHARARHTLTNLIEMMMTHWQYSWCVQLRNYWLKMSYLREMALLWHLSVLNFHKNSGTLCAHGSSMTCPWAHLHTSHMMESPNKGEKLIISSSVSITVWPSSPSSSILCTPSLPTTSLPGQMTSWLSLLISNFVTFTGVFSFLRCKLWMSLFLLPQVKAICTYLSCPWFFKQALSIASLALIVCPWLICSQHTQINRLSIPSITTRGAI